VKYRVTKERPPQCKSVSNLFAVGDKFENREILNASFILFVPSDKEAALDKLEKCFETSLRFSHSVKSKNQFSCVSACMTINFDADGKSSHVNDEFRSAREKK